MDDDNDDDEMGELSIQVRIGTAVENTKDQGQGQQSTQVKSFSHAKITKAINPARNDMGGNASYLTTD